MCKQMMILNFRLCDCLTWKETTDWADNTVNGNDPGLLVRGDADVDIAGAVVDQLWSGDGRVTWKYIGERKKYKRINEILI